MRQYFIKMLDKTLGFVFAKINVMHNQQNTQHTTKQSEKCLQAWQNYRPCHGFCCFSIER